MPTVAGSPDTLITTATPDEIVFNVTFGFALGNTDSITITPNVSVWIADGPVAIGFFNASGSPAPCTAVGSAAGDVLTVSLTPCTGTINAEEVYLLVASSNLAANGAAGVVELHMGTSQGDDAIEPYAWAYADPAVFVAPGPLSVPANAAGATFEVSLSMQPATSATVTVTCTSNDTLVVPDPSAGPTFNSTDYDTPKDAVLDNAVSTSSGSALLTCAASGGGYGGASDAIVVNVLPPCPAVASEGNYTSTCDGGPTFHQGFCNVSCNPGYTGRSDLICNGYTSTYTGSVPSCPEEGCAAGPGDAIANSDGSHTTGCAGTPSRGTCAIACDSGFVPSGSYECVKGAWSAAPTCEDFLVTVSPATITVNEGSARTFEVALSHAPQGGAVVTVACSSDNALAVPDSVASAVFDAGNFSSSQDVAFVTSAAGSAVITCTASDDGGYQSLYDFDTITVTVEDYMVMLSASSITVNEDASATFEMSLSHQPTGDVNVTCTSGNVAAVQHPGTFTFTTGDYNVNQTVTLATLSAGSATITCAAQNQGGYSSSDFDTVSVTVTDYRVILDTASITVNEGSSAGSFLMSLSNQPSGTATVECVSNDTSVVGDPTPSSFFFGAGDFSADQTVNGFTSVAAGTTLIVCTAADAGGYTSNDFATVTVNVRDYEVRSSQTSLTLPAGSTAGSFTIRLSDMPTGSVTVTCQSSNTGVSAHPSPSVFTFTTGDFSSTQTVSLSSAVSEGTTNITCTPTGGDYFAADAVIVPVTVSSNLVIATPTSLIRSAGLGADSVDLVLSDTPAGPVSVSCSSDDNSVVAVTSGAINFAVGNYDNPRSLNIDVRAVGTATITCTPSGGGYSQSLEIDVDVEDFMVVVSPAATVVPEDSTAGWLSVSLSSEPSADVTVTCTSSNTAAVPAPSSSSFTFTSANFNTPQVLDLDGGEAQVGVSTVTCTPSSTGGYAASTDAGSAVVTVEDFTVVATPATVTLLLGATDGRLNVSISHDIASPSITVDCQSSDTAVVPNAAATALVFDSASRVQTFAMGGPVSEGTAVITCTPEWKGGYTPADAAQVTVVVEGCDYVFRLPGTALSCGRCDDDHYHPATGDRAGRARCIACATSCPAGQYPDESLCGGTRSDDSCTDCTAVANCAGGVTCSSASDSTCGTCDTGYYVTATGSCSECTPQPGCSVSGSVCVAASSDLVCITPESANSTVIVDGVVTPIACDVAALPDFESLNMVPVGASNVTQCRLAASAPCNVTCATDFAGTPMLTCKKADSSSRGVFELAGSCDPDRVPAQAPATPAYGNLDAYDKQTQGALVAIVVLVLVFILLVTMVKIVGRIGADPVDEENPKAKAGARSAPPVPARDDDPEGGIPMKTLDDEDARPPPIPPRADL